MFSALATTHLSKWNGSYLFRDANHGKQLDSERWLHDGHAQAVLWSRMWLQQQRRNSNCRWRRIYVHFLS
ncbi:hypothetical protein PFISCL1PPCAC_14356 [Pristionchus fissidentatus]|uniref:Uncharacterized protein n=1 Tax=Pristionchus fissidentatus TaxID=1538716 RepID=A0AAV5VU29_9BILA|nr:hypothetical protein PFISCL1PPCAC_14356 [Pristionchus fissidentatus]